MKVLKKLLPSLLLVMQFTLIAIMIQGPAKVKIWLPQNADITTYESKIIEYTDLKNIKTNDIALVTIKLENSGETAWEKEEGIYLGIRNSISSLGPRGALLPRTVAPGEQLELSIPIAVPALPGAYSLKLQMVKENEYGFGEMLEIPFTVARAHDRKKLENFRLRLSDADVAYFEEFTKASLAYQNKRTDLNNWRKAELDYNGKSYKVEVKIHGGQPIHYKDDIKSYRVRLLGDDKIYDAKEFSLITYADRGFWPLITQFFARKIDIHMLHHRFVYASVNEIVPTIYYFRESSTEDFLTGNGFNDQANFLSRSTIFDNSLNNAIKLEGGGHANILNYEISFDELELDTPYNSSILFRLWELANTIDQHDSKKITGYFDKNYLLNFESIRTLLVNSHDIAGDNLRMIATDTAFLPMLAGESIYSYSNQNIEAQLNREFCANPLTNMSGYGAKISGFAEVNQDPEFRYEKYRRVFELLDRQIMGELIEEINQNSSTINKWIAVTQLNSLVYNRNLLIAMLSKPKIFTEFTDTDLSISSTAIYPLKTELIELNFDNLKAEETIQLTIRTENGPNKTLTAAAKNQNTILIPANEIALPVLVTKSDLEFYAPRTTISWSTEYSLRDYKIEGINQLNNQLIKHTEQTLTSTLKEFAELNGCNNLRLPPVKEVIANPPSYSDRLPAYKNLWADLLAARPNYILNLRSKYGTLLKSLPNFIEDLPHKAFWDVIATDINLGKLFINVVSDSNKINLELIPISLSGLKIEELIIQLETPINKNQTLSLKLRDKDNNLVRSNRLYVKAGTTNIELNKLISNYNLYNEIDELGRIKKAKYRITVEGINKTTALTAKDIKSTLRNYVTGRKLLAEDLNIVVIAN